MVFRGRCPGCAGVVDQNVDATEFCDRPISRALDVFVLRVVGRDEPTSIPRAFRWSRACSRSLALQDEMIRRAP
jgi:hypothetical protein